MKYPMNNYKLQGFQKSTRQYKKYDAILLNKQTNRTVKVPFGDNRYEHYMDKTPLKIWSRLDHNDKERRRLYRLRHNKDISPNNYSAGYFAMNYLW